MATVNRATVDLVKKYEGFRSQAYLCPAGVWTVGYGTTTGAGVGLTVQQDTTVTKIEAEHYLEKGLASFAAKIRPHIAAPINDNEFGAFVSLAYNIGPAAFIKSSALRHFNEGDKAKAAAAIKLWNKARVDGTLRVMNGLINRREDEVRLFQTPPTLAPSPTVADRPNSLVAVLVLLLQRILSALLKRGSK